MLGTLVSLRTFQYLHASLWSQPPGCDELLAMDVDYDAIKPAVAPTVQMTEELENIIIQRIRDKGKNWTVLAYGQKITSYFENEF